MPAHWFAALTAIGSAAVQCLVFLRWLHRRMRDDEIVRACVRDIALAHLPHIHASLRQLAAQQGTELAETPLVHFVEFNGHRRAS